jgi:hypothetical protein
MEKDEIKAEYILPNVNIYPNNKWVYYFGFKGSNYISEDEAKELITHYEEINPEYISVISCTAGIIPRPCGDEYDKELKQRSDALIKKIYKFSKCQTI